MRLDFTAIDFETANPRRASICSVGLAKFRDGRLVDTFERLIRPPAGLDDFSHWNVRVHGITPSMVASMSTWDAVFHDFDHFIGNDLLLAHNAAFDISVLIGACAVYGITPRSNEYACTLELSRAQLRLENYKLPTVAAAVGVNLADHHDALSDAVATGQIAAALASKSRHSGDLDLTEQGDRAITVDVLGAGRRRRAGGSRSGGPRPEFEVLPDADPGHFFFGRKFVFTGQLESLARDEATALVTSRGGRVTGTVSRMTSVLVVGGWDPTSLDPSLRGLSGKASKALQMLQAGHDLRIWTEEDLIANL